ncbi:MAG: hypothetical protein RL693_2843 [Verrucomicrobiota bacterium]|jgi:hypothetical protein
MTVLDQLRKVHTEHSEGKIDSKMCGEQMRAILKFDSIGPPLLFRVTSDLRRLMLARPGPHFERQATALIDSISQALKKSHGIRL